MNRTTQTSRAATWGAAVSAAIFALLATSLHAAPASRFVECETFTDYGGWVVDPHSMKRMGSSYLMAHGYGVPVKDATRIVNFAEAGRYTVHVRTRDWSAEWRKGRGTPPGRFQVLVNGKPVGDAVLGTNGGTWAWQRAGEVDLPVGDATVALHDLTGFNARCDVVYFSKDPDDVPPNDARELEAYRPKKRHFSTVTDKTSYDLIVVGGGISGMCVAQSAARLGVRVLLLQDRGVLGGCNSSEIRVSLGGRVHQPPYPALGNLVDEFAPAFGGNKTYPAEWYEDTRKENVFRRTTQSCTLKFNEHVFAVEMDAAQTNRIRAVLSRNTRTGHETRFRAALFCDATGDAVLARLAGCETMYGREARARFNESCAPERPVRQVMGHSVQWYAARTDAPVSFPDIDWGLPVTESSCYYVRTGDWEQEAGQYRDMADDTEAIRDYGLLSIFSNWSFLKNRSARKAEFANDRIEWVSPIGGKRESYRVVGDHVLTQNDIEDHVAYPDLTAAVTWNIDLHFPDPENEAKFEDPFRSCAYHRHYGRPYAVPYRCLYARDCANLFLAGRHVSCSHVAFAAVRVMRTLGMLGEVAGMAAAVCKKHGCLPRDVYADHLDELKGLMRKGVPKLGVYHSGGCSGDNEFYHFKDTGHFPIWPKPRPMTPRVRDAIEKIGLRHRHEPEKQN